MADTPRDDELAAKIASAVAEATRRGTPISHGVARAIAVRYRPVGRAPKGRAVYRKALGAFIASGVMQKVNTTPPCWAPHPSADINPADALFRAVAGEGTWGMGSDADKDALAALGDYLLARQMAEDIGAVDGWQDMSVQ